MSLYDDQPPDQLVGLPITTRGIGLGICNLCYIAAAADIEAPVYAAYRACLGLVEAKLRECGSFLTIRRECRYEYQVMPYMFRTPCNVAIVPTPIKRIIDAIDNISHNGTKYRPFVAAQVRDAAGKLVPRPENLLLSNLREVVVALSSPETPVAYRAAFKANCPIPGAVWDDDLLMNADEIIPEGYNLDDDLSDDMWPLQMFLITMQEKYPSMASGPLLRVGARASMAALITNDMGDVRAKPRHVGETLRDYCRRCHPQGSLGPYYRLLEMSEADILDGQAALLGEHPNAYALGKALLGPVLEAHAPRLGKLNSARLRAIDVEEYAITLMVTNEALLSPSAPQPAGGDAPAAAPPARNGRGRGPRNRRGNQNR